MVGSNFQDRRRYKRRNLIYYIPVIESDTQHPIGRMADVSAKGFKLDSETEIPPGKDFQLGLNTTPDIADISFIGFVARSKWCQADTIEPCQYYVGFDIVDIEPHAARIVQCMVDKYGASDTPIQ
ncbi:MAG: PilZ domain-containing protein [Anaerolineales bacterium]|jgi:hypothetical protein